jgi:hypothetical protein
MNLLSIVALNSTLERSPNSNLPRCALHERSEAQHT